MNQPPPSPGVPILEPKAIKVLGILHIVFGCWGALQVLMGVVSLMFNDVFLKLQSGGNEDMEAIQKQMAAEMRIPTVVALIISLVITVLILRAGIKLVRIKKDAVKASTIYSYASITGKIFGLILAVTYTIPIMNRQFEGMAEQMGGAAGAGGAQLEQMMEMMKTTASVTGVISPLVMCVYPILSLVLLKKKNVSEFLAQHGK